MRVMDFRGLDFELRPATDEDFRFAWSLYRELIKAPTVELLEWNELGQKSVVEEALAHDGAFIIVTGGSNAGWLQACDTPTGIYLAQLYILPSLQSRGIGTAIVRQLIDRARQEGKTLTLDVMKNNSAQLFYKRLGFCVVGTSKYKFKMQWREEA